MASGGKLVSPSLDAFNNATKVFNHAFSHASRAFSHASRVFNHASMCSVMRPKHSMKECYSVNDMFTIYRE